MKKIIKSSIAHPQYFELINTIYGASPETKRYIDDSMAGMNTIIANGNFSTTYFHLIEDNRLIGHIALICTSKEDAFFGFFELTNNAYFNDLWQAILADAKQKGVKLIFGPVNGTIWHPYRVIQFSSSDPFFIQEPLSQCEYFDLFKNCIPINTIEYHSAFRTNFSFILNFTSNSLGLVKKENIQIVQKEFSNEILKIIYDLSIAIFSSNPGFYHLSYADFIALYAGNNRENANIKIFIATHDGKPIGFSYNLLAEKTLIMKTIGLLPEWQEKGIGNAMVHEVHRFANDNQIEKVIYALIRSDNRVKNFPKEDAVVFRKYAAFVFKIL